jgi:hypothetical protein
MPYVLYSVSRQCRVSDLFATEDDVWVHVHTQGLCSEVVDREDLDLQRILNPDYEIHICGADGTRLDDSVIRQRS